MKSFPVCVFLMIFCVSLSGQSRQNDLPNSGKYVSYRSGEYSSGDIIFPNAFKWNGGGPTGGYWSENQQNDNIFRPFCTNVADYRLKIFSRWGSLVYESSDIHKGWDGYSRQGNLAFQGVYIWIVTGRYNDGTYFNKIGDVTFLH